jgi:hypothetical protein
LTNVDETDLSSKVEELMNTLDQVKKYKEMARSMVDFALILLSSIVAILFVYIATDWYQGLIGPLPSNIITPYAGGIVLSDVQGLSAFVVFLVGLIGGIALVSRRMARVKIGEWKPLQKQDTLGAMKILSSLDWPTVFEDIRYSKFGFIMYSILKIIGYWILGSFLVYLAFGFPLSLVHAQLSTYEVFLISLVLVLALSRKDLQRRYNQSWALDSLLWELRWFDSEFRGKAEFGKTSG